MQRLHGLALSSFMVADGTVAVRVNFIRSISPIPGALVLFNPVFDNGPDGFGHSRVRDRWQEFSPLHNIATGVVPPAIVFLGTKDPLLSVSTAASFKMRMNEAGTRCDVWTYTDQKHAFFNYCDGRNPCFNATVYEADKFLASLGYLDGEPTVQVRELPEVVRSTARQAYRRWLSNPRHPSLQFKRIHSHEPIILCQNQNPLACCVC